MVFKSGQMVKDWVRSADGSKVDDKQVQPHGVELTVDKIYECKGQTVITDDGYLKSNREEASLVSAKEYTQDDYSIEVDDHYFLPAYNSYVVKYNERIEIPEDHMGLVFPRSRFIRSNNFISTAVWDSGYKGIGEGGLHINTPTVIEKDMRIAQIAFAKAKTFNQYDGSHQGENLDE